LSLFLNGDRSEIDCNVVERSIVGSDGGAEHWAVVVSPIETCKLIGVKPPASSTATRRLDELLAGPIRPPSGPQRRGLTTALTSDTGRCRRYGR
jgi:hypothetical protein